MKKLIAFYLLTLFLFQISLCVNAEEKTANAKFGTVRGRIVDTGKQTLPGASIYIEQLQTGVISDVNGFYVFPNLSAGSYTIKVSYVGYKSLEMSITIPEGKTLERNVVLNEGVELQEVFVGGTFQGYQKAINSQKNSLGIVNVVSADQVGRFPDANIGDALKRVSGINVQYDQGEARFGQIRGTSPDLSSVMINGNRIPSAEGDARNVQLDLIPADMIQTIEVNKVITPDMDADAIGGSVNLVTKNSPYKRMVSATIGSGWNFISEKAQLNAALTYGDKFLNNKLGVILAGSYQNNPGGSDNTEFVWKQKSTGEAYVSDYQIRQYAVQRERQSYSGAFNYEFNPNHHIDFKAIFNNRNDWENRYRMTLKDISEAGVAKSVRFQTKGGTANNKSARLEQQQTMDFALGGEHLFGKLTFDWKASFAKASEERPNERYIGYELKKQTFTSDLSDPRRPILTPVKPSSITLDDNFSLQELTEQQGDVQEKDWKFGVNFQLPLTKGKYANKLKFGAKSVFKSKKRDIKFYDYEPTSDTFNQITMSNLIDKSKDNFMAGDYHAGTFVSKDYLGSLNLNNNTLFKKTENVEELASNFNAYETVTAGYLRFDQQIGKKWDIMAGLRLENTHLKYSGMQLLIDADENKSIEPTSEYKDDYLNVLPSLLVKYNASDNLKVRASFTNTLARPKYYDLVPHVSINQSDSEVALGNSTLKPTLSYNLDLSGEYYFKSIGLVSAGIFYKKINDFIVDQRLTDSEYNGVVYTLVTQPKNAGNADLLGVELAYQRDFGFIAPFMKYFGFYGNYTYTHTKVNNFNFEGRENETDLSMPGSPKYTANASLYFERKGLNLRVSYNYASSFIDGFGTEKFSDRYYDAVHYMDINASYTFNKHYTFFAEANNLLNQPLRYYQGEKDRTAQAEYYGVKINAGFKLNF